jgi:IclR family transcriptional regulator, pca regulon regulatory protein
VSTETSGLPAKSRGDRAGPLPPDKEFMATLEKGLSVLGAFGEQRQHMTLSEAAAITGLSRATARRILRTLTALGYLLQDGRRFSLAPRVLELGFAYLSTQSWIDRAEPKMKELSHALGESCSAAILQDTEIVYVARMPAPHRLMSLAIAIGTRLPAFHSALGRIQIGYLPEAEIWRRLKSIRLAPHTPHTIVDPRALVERILADRAQGFSIVDEELETGLRAIAVPVVARSGACIAALNVSAHASRSTRNAMREEFLPALQKAAAEVSETIF